MSRATKVYFKAVLIGHSFLGRVSTITTWLEWIILLNATYILVFSRIMADCRIDMKYMLLVRNDVNTLERTIEQQGSLKESVCLFNSISTMRHFSSISFMAHFMSKFNFLRGVIRFFKKTIAGNFYLFIFLFLFAKLYYLYFYYNFFHNFIVF